MDGTWPLAIVGLLGLAAVVVFALAWRARSIRAETGVGQPARSAPVPEAVNIPAQIEGDFDWDEEVRSDLRILSDTEIDRLLVVPIAHMMVCYQRYRADIPDEYDKICAQVAEVAGKWVYELTGGASSGNANAHTLLHHLYYETVPDNLELYAPAGHPQPRVTAYEAFLLCGMPDIYAKEWR